MNKEEAIRTVETDYFLMEDYEKVKEIIKALEENPCEDAISREAMLNYQQYLHGRMSNEENHKLWEFIKDLPSVTLTPKWIPVSERLPEQAGEYLVTYHPCYWGQVREDIKVGLDSFRGKTTWAKNKYQKVIAWKPLPIPYKEESEDKE